MKTFLLIISFVFLGATSFAADSEPICKVSDIKLNLLPTSSAACTSLKIEGPYKLKTCDNDRGLLTNADGYVRYVFKDDKIWGARLDSIDLDRNVSTSEIFKFDFVAATFLLHKSQQKRDGTYLEKFECRGTIESTTLNPL
ncbi:MAG: hypothetical protein AABY64_06570 [Bdellovibrionota bacterium]